MKKVSNEYKKQIGRNIEEKIYFWKKLLKSNKKRISILEISSGGGETLKNIKDLCKHGENLYAVDIKDKFVKLSKSIIGSNAVKANVCKLPFRDNFFDAINASSLLHEVYSYGYTNGDLDITGFEALKTSLDEIKRVLKINGFLYYRDVLAPKNRLPKMVVYTSASIKYFIDLFLEKFVNTEPYIYKGKYIIEKKDGKYIINAENFLHREIQKHYILCLENLSDYLLLKENINIGNLNKVNELFVLEKIFSRFVLQNNVELKKRVLKWLLREGKEKYLYYTNGELIEFCKKNKDKKSYILSSVKTSLKHRFIRNEENLFIKKLIINAEEEGKQEIVFTKIKI